GRFSRLLSKPDLRMKSFWSCYERWLLPAFSSRLRRVISITRAHAGAGDAAHFHFDLPVAAIARFIGWIVTQTVLSADLVGDLRECAASLLQVRRGKIPSSGYPRQLAHLLPGEVV